MPKTNPPYPPEFRRESIRLVRSAPEERPISRIARELGVCAETLRNWVKQGEIDAGERQGLTTEERQELARLRKETRPSAKSERYQEKRRPSSPARTGFGKCFSPHRCGEGALSRRGAM
jgi:transposase